MFVCVCHISKEYLLTYLLTERWNFRYNSERDRNTSRLRHYSHDDQLSFLWHVHWKKKPRVHGTPRDSIAVCDSGSDSRVLEKKSDDECVTNARFPLPELTARVDGWPVYITRQHPSTRYSTSRVDGRSVCKPQPMSVRNNEEFKAIPSSS